ncbi:MAG: hypothetical protein JWQ81_2499 [Amycolatopsis sp.]|nr:hypothetical protein [Amycolatopsis sp.]
MRPPFSVPGSPIDCPESYTLDFVSFGGQISHLFAEPRRTIALGYLA